MVIPHGGQVSQQALEQPHASWLAAAIVIHGMMCVLFGVIYGVLLPRLRPIPGPVAWGGLLLPLLWTAVSYGLMGVVNPVLQERVYWPGFVVSQFVFGVTAAVVVLRSEMIFIPPAGRGPEPVGDHGTGAGTESSQP
jgi:hypothetical protein